MFDDNKNTDMVGRAEDEEIEAGGDSVRCSFVADMMQMMKCQDKMKSGDQKRMGKSPVADF